jgi:hypothetical protein
MLDVEFSAGLPNHFLSFSSLLLGFGIPRLWGFHFFTYGLGLVWRIRKGLESVRAITSIAGAIFLPYMDDARAWTGTTCRTDSLRYVWCMI